MKIRLLLFITILQINSIKAQWIQRSNFPGEFRVKSTSFTLNNKIYVIGGFGNSGATLKDVWQYDIATDTWLQKNDFAGAERYAAIAFVVDGNAYVGTGGNDNGYLDDLWRYNESSDTWTTRTGLPAGSAQHENQRRESWSFVVGNKAYLGGGDGFVFGPNSTTNIAFYDIWEYNPITNTWTQKSDMPDFIGRDFSIAGAINNKGYVGLGCNVDQNINRQSFWEYDPTNDTWTSKHDFPSQFTTDANAFVLNSQLFVAGGVKFNPVTLTDQVYSYDPVSDTWTQSNAFNGGAIAGAISGFTDSAAFLGTGYNGGLTMRHDFWEYTTLNTEVSNFDSDKNPIVKIYPNPFSGSTTIELNKNVKAGHLDILDLYGSVVSRVEINSVTTQFNCNLASGVYEYHLSNDDGTFENGKLIVE